MQEVHLAVEKTREKVPKTLKVRLVSQHTLQGTGHVSDESWTFQLRAAAS